MKLGEIIKKYRENNDLSLNDMAIRSGFSKTYISMLENDYNPSTKKAIIPSAITLKKCSAAMNMSLDELVKMLDPNQKINLIPNISESLSPSEQSLVADYRKLNSIGQKKGSEYVHDLTENPKYTIPSEPIRKKDA